MLVADQVSKALVVSRLRWGEPIDLVWTLRLNRAENTGMAFSRGASSGPIIGVVALGIVVVLCLFARKMTSRLQLVLVGIVAGGALGNIADRLFRAQDGFMSGAVVDFIDVQWWPIFNVADMAVVVGGLALALTGFVEPDRDGQEDGAPEDGAPEDGSPADGSPADGAPSDDAERSDERAS